MELSPDTIGHLRDEAYATLCRHTLTEALEKLVHEKANIENTRPPFALLVSRQTRDAFSQSMSAVIASESALQVRLAEISQIEQLIQGLVHPALHKYLTDCDPSYRSFPQIQRILHDWESAFRALPDLLVAFARDARNARQQCGHSEPEQRDREPLLLLRDSALRLEKQLDALDRAALQLTALLPAGADAEIQLPATPAFRYANWVGLLLALPLERFVAELHEAEAAVRQFQAANTADIEAFLSESSAACDRFEQGFLEHYWDQLRAHAQAHYVDECEIDDVIRTLSQNYIESDLARRQRELTTSDPFLGER